MTAADVGDEVSVHERLWELCAEGEGWSFEVAHDQWWGVRGTCPHGSWWGESSGMLDLDTAFAGVLQQAEKVEHR